MEYNFRAIEKKWQKYWYEHNAYKVSNDFSKPKYYVLDMFPYPSGAGLHVGHPLGYIASDIFARYKRLKGFNVLHPMGYDAFGLPAEQYAIDHGIHPAVSTEKNIATFESQLNNIGFCYDWSRKVNTSDPTYYKWTQWIFLQLFNSWFNRKTQKASPINTLETIFAEEGNLHHECPGDDTIQFSAHDWESFSDKEKADILMHYRLAYCGYGDVNWCEALGTVLANDEVVNGVSERGGFPVERKRLRQWYLRITEYADRLLQGLQTVDFSDAMKDMQTNWIGKSVGAEITFKLCNTSSGRTVTVYTTRPDTIFGVDFMVLAPELDYILDITTPEQKSAVEAYINYVKSRSERERMAEKKITGCFTGAYVSHPFDENRKIPIWISEYVLAGYGTGAIMAVPCGDERDFKFAQHFSIPITNILGEDFNGTEANASKEATLSNSRFLDGVKMKDAIAIVLDKIQQLKIGKAKTMYRMRDAAFSRQRYWGEPFPIIWDKDIVYPLQEKDLPLQLPEMTEIKPGKDGQGPLSNMQGWIVDVQKNLPLKFANTATELTHGGIRESSTMPGYAGSSWYFLRYMDPDNEEVFCSKEASDYWNQVDLYIGGTEHAVGHLLYARMWTKFLFDLGKISFDEPFKRLVNQGMIQGSSRFVYRITGTNQFVSFGQKDNYTTEPLHVDVNIVDGYELDIEKFRQWKPEYADADFIFEDGTFSLACAVDSKPKYICGSEVEKMSKRYFNTVNPDDLVNTYGADTFRMYEMFLGPVEQSKPWETKGIEGVHRFLKKLWRLFYDNNQQVWNNDPAQANELKILHKAIQKIENDTERFSFNTAVSTFMVCVNELTEAKCYKKEILEKLLILLAPYAPHVSEELWHVLGHQTSILDAPYPVFEAKYVQETEKDYPVSINGKMRTNITFSLDTSAEEIEEKVLANEIVQKWMDGKPLKKLIFVKGKMINVVI